MKYNIIKYDFPGLRSKVVGDLTYSEAVLLSERWDKESDDYTSFKVEEMEQNIKEIRKEKLDKLKKL